MTRFLFLTIVAVLVGSSPASAAACRRFGTQLDCHAGPSRIVIGTQAAEEPTYARSFPANSLQGAGAFPSDRTRSPRPLVIELQNFGTDLDLCRKVGNETYCY